MEEFATYPRQFESYKWYKPIIVGLITCVGWILATFVGVGIYLISIKANGVNIAAFMESAGENTYDSFDAYSVAGALMSLGSLAAIIPSLMIAAKIVRDRPFSSYSSSRGGWDFKAFGKCMFTALVVVGIPVGVLTVLGAENTGVIRFSVAGFIVCTLLGPLQCIGEEYAFRGLVLQTLGGWFGKAVVAIVGQAFLFAMMHPYDLSGVIEIMISGILMGCMACYSRGLEASSANHIANNMVLFYLNGFGFESISSQTNWTEIVQVIMIDGLYLLAIILLDRKFGWFQGTKDISSEE